MAELSRLDREYRELRRKINSQNWTEVDDARYIEFLHNWSGDTIGIIPVKEVSDYEFSWNINIVSRRIKRINSVVYTLNSKDPIARIVDNKFFIAEYA